MRWGWALVTVAAAGPAAAEPIVGGDPEAALAFPTVGVLTAATQLRCTAVVIAPDVVMTAAHCLDAPAFGYLAFTLDSDLSDGAQGAVKVALTHAHPDFEEAGDALLDLTVRNDIGVAILEHPLEGVAIEPLDRVADRVAELSDGAELAMCGYGRTVWDRVGAGVKRGATVVVDRMADYELATVSRGPQPCSGDSGGPLYLDTPDGRVLAGIVSRAVGSSKMCDTGAIATRIAPYTGWLAEAAADRDSGCSSGGGGWLGLLALLGLRRRA